MKWVRSRKFMQCSVVAIGDICSEIKCYATVAIPGEVSLSGSICGLLYIYLRCPCCRPADWSGGRLWGRRDPRMSRIRRILPAASHKEAGYRRPRYHQVPDQGEIYYIRTYPINMRYRTAWSLENHPGIGFW